ncbi:hypothetical protein [Pontiella sp.]|uniref:hypothetical protein n=1 Tax=Pontiella sp. TaxID=2837462 RepID=UPI0035685D4C
MDHKKLLMVGAVAAAGLLSGCSTAHIKNPLVAAYPNMEVGQAELLARPTEYGITIDDKIVSATASGKRFLGLPLKGAKHYTLNSRIAGSFSPTDSLQAEACNAIFDANPDAEGLFVVRIVTEAKRTILPGTGTWDTTVYAKKLKITSYGVMEADRADILKGMRIPAGDTSANTINLKMVE